MRLAAISFYNPVDKLHVVLFHISLVQHLSMCRYRDGFCVILIPITDNSNNQVTIGKDYYATEIHGSWFYMCKKNIIFVTSRKDKIEKTSLWYLLTPHYCMKFGITHIGTTWHLEVRSCKSILNYKISKRKNILFDVILGVIP